MAYDAKITRIGAMALFDLKGTESALRNWTLTLPIFPANPNTMTPGTPELLHIGRNHWLLRAPLSEEPTLDNALKPAQSPADISIIRLSDSQCFFSITGPDADQILSIATSLDIHPSAFPDTAVTYSEAFGLKALISRHQDGFLIGVEQSFGDMIEDYFAKAMR